MHGFRDLIAAATVPQACEMRRRARLVLYIVSGCWLAFVTALIAIPAVIFL